MKNLAVLITCYNRINTTLKCLDNLFAATLPEDFKMDVYLVDDNSPDQTGRIVKNKYSGINVIHGTGKLYWTGGMRLAWETAVKTKDYDFYLWLNDDTYIENNAITSIVEDWAKLEKKNIESIIVGAFFDPDTKEITYSGWINGKIISPSGEPEKCDFIVGNFVLVPRQVFRRIGQLSKNYSHGIGDTDYGYRVINYGYQCNVSSKYLGTAKMNVKKPWFYYGFSFFKRVKLLFAKNNGNIIEYLQFVKVHRGVIHMLGSLLKTIIRLFLPRLFKRNRK